MRIIQRPRDARAVHARFSLTSIFMAALVASCLSLMCGQTFGALAQQAYIKATNTRTEFWEPEYFGASVAIWGDTMVVGAPNESSDHLFSGAAYIYVRNGTNWTPQAYLKSSDSQPGYLFGSAVAIHSNTVVIGAPGVNDGQFGAAYVFVRNGADWSEQARLSPSNEGGDFGAAVAVWSNTVVIGASTESSDGNGVNGDQTPYNTSLSGAAYVFERTGVAWNQQAYLKASNAEADDEFGVAVGISGNTVVVGARGEDSNATTVDGNQADNSNDTSGAAYVFVRNGAAWTQQAYLKASSYWSRQAFGSAIAVSGDTIVIGAPDESGGARGVNGNPAGEPKVESGAAFVFSRNGATWTQQAYLKASNTGDWDHFGGSVAVSGDTVVIGARDEDSNAAGVNGNQGSDSATNSGAAYLFSRSGTNWFSGAYLKASNPDGGADALLPADAFGYSVGVSGETTVVGAPGEASNATGVNGNQGDNSLSNAGAAYVFVNAPAASSKYGSIPLPGSTINFGRVREGEADDRKRTLIIFNQGNAPLTIASISAGGDPRVTIEVNGSQYTALPHTMPPNDGGYNLDVKLTYDGTGDGLRLLLNVLSDDPIAPNASYELIGINQDIFEYSGEATILRQLNGLTSILPELQSGGTRKKTELTLPPSATFVLATSGDDSLTTEIPSFFGGGSVTLSNFIGSFTVSLLPIPNDTNRAAVRVESGSFTAPSFTLPSGLVSGPNVLTFGPPEQSSGLLYLTNGYYEVAATATITNSLIPNGVTVRGNYTGVYNFETGQANLQSDSRDLFEVSERLQLNYSPSGLWLTWANTNAVEEATDVTGPWQVLTNAASPHLVQPTNAQQFFRLATP